MVTISSTLPSTETAAQTIALGIHQQLHVCIFLQKSVKYCIIMITGSATIPSPSSPIMAGDTVTLTCSVTLPHGVTGTPDFQWVGPGVPPTPADPTTSGEVVSSDLTLSEIATSQAGQYTCTATLNGSVNTSITIAVQSKITQLHALLCGFLHVIPFQSQFPLYPSLSVILTLCMLELHSV